MANTHKKRNLLLGTLCAVVLLGGGITAYLGMQSGAAGLPVPTLSGETAFTVTQDALTADAVYQRGEHFIHFKDRPGVLTRAETVDKHHFIARFKGSTFGISSAVPVYDLLLGKAFYSCVPGALNADNVWVYVYDGTEKTEGFKTANYWLSPCGSNATNFTQYARTLATAPNIAPETFVYIKMPTAAIAVLEDACYGEGFCGGLKAVIGYDRDQDGLLEYTEEHHVGLADDPDADLDGLLDGLEVAGGRYETVVGGNTVVREVANDVLGWSNPDTDWDGIHDPTELGLVASQDPNPDNSVLFVADADPSTMTNPAVMDTDDGGICDGPPIYGIACDDNQDGDGDGDTDFPADDGCVSAVDRSELPTINCSGVEDLNANGAIDAGETDPNDGNDDIPPAVACGDGIDNDSDGLTDQDDPGCYDPQNVVTGTFSATDEDEAHTAVCGNGANDQTSEDCDDANNSNEDACTNGCIAAVCGDGFLQPLGANGVDDADGSATDDDEDCEKNDDLCDINCKEVGLPGSLNTFLMLDNAIPQSQASSTFLPSPWSTAPGGREFGMALTSGVYSCCTYSYA